MGLEGELLKDIRVLEIVNGPSGGYAGRLFAESGATVKKVQMNSTSASEFRDQKKVIVNTAHAIKTIQILLTQHWDIILWDSHSNYEIHTLLSTHIKSSNSCIGILIQFPKEVNEDEEYTLQAIGGWMALTGEPDQPPLTVGGYTASYLVGAHAATASLLSLLERSWTTKGRLVEINALTIAVSALEGAYSTFVETGISRTRTGNRHNKLAPMAILPAADGWTFVGAPVDEKWELLERWAGLEHRLEWSSNENRRENVAILEEELSKWSSTMERTELFLTGQAFRLPFAKVQTPEEVLCCPHLNDRKVWQTSSSRLSGIMLPWKISASVPSKKEDLYSKPTSWKGLRILDLTSMWSGPYCTRILADLGVEVIKVETPHRPDGIRSNQGSSAPFFRELNRNKLGIQLDLYKTEDRHTFLEIVSKSDILVENFSPRVMENFGLTPDELWKHRPDLTIVSLSAFGQTGPYRDFVGYGPTIEAISGVAALTSSSNSVPWLPGFSVSDMGAGIHGSFSLLAALIFRNREGIGLRVDVSQYETACQFIGDYLIEKIKPNIPKKPVFVRGIAELSAEESLNRLSIVGDSPVLGMPWESQGWETKTVPPPELGQHNEEILSSLVR